MERRGYFFVDKIELQNQKMTLNFIPDGKSKNMSVIESKLDQKQVAGGKTDAAVDKAKDKKKAGGEPTEGLSKKELVTKEDLGDDKVKWANFIKAVLEQTEAETVGITDGTNAIKDGKLVLVPEGELKLGAEQVTQDLAFLAATIITRIPSNVPRLCGITALEFS